MRQHYKDGADLIKIMPSGGVLDESASVDNAQMTIDEIKAVVAAAHDYGFTVAAHAHGTEAIRRAVIGGVDSIEHGTFMDDADIKLMKEHGTWYVPTIIAGKYVEEKAIVPGYYPPQIAAKAKLVGPIIQADSRQGVQGRRQDRVRHRCRRSIRTARTPRSSSTWSRPACRPAFVLQAATTHAAELLKKTKDLGTVEPGKFADVIAVEGNPLEDITLMQKVAFVMKEGVVYKQDGKPANPVARRRNRRFEPRKAKSCSATEMVGSSGTPPATARLGFSRGWHNLRCRYFWSRICQTRHCLCPRYRPSSTSRRPISRPRSSMPRSISRCSSTSGRHGASRARRSARCSKKSSPNTPAR